MSRDLGVQRAALAAKRAELTSSLTDVLAELDKIKKGEEKEKKECDALAAQATDKAAEEEKADADIKQLKKANQQVFSDMASLEKTIISREAIIEKLNTVRKEIFRRSELESVPLPFLSAAAAAKKRRGAASKGAAAAASSRGGRRGPAGGRRGAAAAAAAADAMDDEEDGDKEAADADMADAAEEDEGALREVGDVCLVVGGSKGIGDVDPKRNMWLMKNDCRTEGPGLM